MMIPSLSAKTSSLLKLTIIFFSLLLLSGLSGCQRKTEETNSQSLVEILQYEARQNRKYASKAQTYKGLETIPSFISDLNSENERARSTAAVALGILGSKEPSEAANLVPYLKLALQDDEPVVRYSAALALGRIGATSTNPSTIVQVLITATEDDNSQVRDSATIALARIGPKDSSVVPALIAAMEDKNVGVRSTGAEALARIGKKDPLVIPGFLETLEAKKAHVRSIAAYGLGYMGAAASSAIPELVVALEDHHPMVRRSATTALGRIGKEPSLTVPALIIALTDEDQKVRSIAMSSLQKINKENSSVIPLLLAALKDEDPAVREGIATAFKRVKAEPSLVIPALVEALGDENKGVRRSAARSLGKIESRSSGSGVVPALVEAFQKGDSFAAPAGYRQLQESASFALQEIGISAAPAVVSIIFSSNGEVRSPAIALTWKLIRFWVFYSLALIIMISLVVFFIRNPRIIINFLFLPSEEVEGTVIHDQ